ncbi:MAG: avidin/streptavidin family protein [Chloroflexota bacterium]
MASLSGKWYNELGSMIEIEVVGDTITGTFTPNTDELVGVYPLTGRTDSDPSPDSQAFGFVVAWHRGPEDNLHSVTAWSGQYQTIDGKEALTTQWLLTREHIPEHNWSSTVVGHDTFTRTPPSEEMIEEHLHSSFVTEAV